MTPDLQPPTVLFIEFTSHCNMHCAFCPSDLLRRKSEHIDEKNIESFLAQLHELGIRAPVLCNVLGEPLLNKRLYAYLDIFERSGHPVTLITNMTLLRDKEVQREILRHNNVTLALSQQTVTKESYKMRGYPRLKFKDFSRIAFEVIEEKFRMGSSARLEVHVASNFVVSNDPTIQRDSDWGLWQIFRDEKEELVWIQKFLKRLEKFSKNIRQKYPQHHRAEEDLAFRKYREHIGTKIAITREMLPADFHHLKDEVFWGYMFLPNVFLVFKALELWTRDYEFVRSVIPAGKFLFIEEKEKPWLCPMTANLGILANGDFIICCLDYEAEMRLGNIRDTPVRELLSSPKRKAVRENAMTQAVCRRCKGNLFLFDTAPLEGSSQIIDKFGNGWEAPEKDLYGAGGRWTREKASAYVYARIKAKKIGINFFSEHEDAALFRLNIHSYDEIKSVFSREKGVEFQGQKRNRSEFEAGFDFEISKLYKIELFSPTFIPDDIYGNGDRRRLGIAVFELSLRE
jgi:MoaA/NifB/PqqE/SkfB family radical SAM enzyme